MTQPKPNDGFEWTQAASGLALRCRALLAIAPHVFTTAAVQLRDDEREWAAVAADVGVDAASVRLIRQVHGRGVAVSRRGDAAPVDRPEADIIISDDANVAVGVRVADCAPILLADRRLGVVGAAHAGWRGTMHDVAGRAVLALRETFRSRPSDLIAAVGPCLGPCCGEMGPEVVEAFRRAGYEADIDRWFTPGASGRPRSICGSQTGINSSARASSRTRLMCPACARSAARTCSTRTARRERASAGWLA